MDNNKKKNAKNNNPTTTKKKRRNRKQKKKEKHDQKENEALEIFKQRIKDVEISCERFKTDEMYRRFLRARQLNVDKAVEMFQNTLKWRKENDVDNAIENFKKCKNYDNLMAYWPGEMIGLDREGVPVYYESIGRVDPKIVDCVPQDDLILFHLYQMETQHQRVFEMFKKGNISSYSPMVIVQDLSSLAWKHYYTPGFNVVKRILDIDQSHYPECLKRFYVINTPTIFKVMWKVVKPMIDARTLEKIVIMGSDYQESLFKDVAKEQVPVEFGGTVKKELPKAGKFSDVKDDGTTSNPVTISISRSDKHEVPIQIPTEGSNLAWEFKTQAHDIGFSIVLEDNGERNEVLKYERYDAAKEQVNGSLERIKSGKYLLVFDNTFSYLRSKSLTYQVFISAPVEKSLNEIDPQVVAEESESKTGSSEDDDEENNENKEDEDK